MGIIWWAVKALARKARGPEKNWANPNCILCGGTGQVHGAGNWFERCRCVRQAQQDAITRAVHERQQERQRYYPRIEDQAMAMPEGYERPPKINPQRIEDAGPMTIEDENGNRYTFYPKADD